MNRWSISLPPKKKKHPCCTRYPIALGSNPKDSPGGTKSLLCQGKPKPLQHKAVSGNNQKAVKEILPSRPQTRRKGLLLAGKYTSCAKKYIPVCRSYRPASYIRITWEPLSGTFQKHSPISESLLSYSAEESRAFLLTKIYLTQKCQE